MIPIAMKAFVETKKGANPSGIRALLCRYVGRLALQQVNLFGQMLTQELLGENIIRGLDGL